MIGRTGVTSVDWPSLDRAGRPIIVIPVYRGGERFQRCLASLAGAPDYFAAIVVSINGPAGSPDHERALEYQAHAGLPVEILNTTVEMNSMSHIRFWASELRNAGLATSATLMWMGHDDELNPEGLRLVAPHGRWPLAEDTMVLGPWVVRHEAVDEVTVPAADDVSETWTCFPDPWVIKRPSMEWVCDQLMHPTYLNLTGGVFTFESLLAMIDFPVRKKAGMRAEMTLATAPKTTFITEFDQPIVIVYGRADSDRATIPTSDARSDDRHLIAWLSRYAIAHPRTGPRLIATIGRLTLLKARVAAGRASLPSEDWVVRA